MCSDPIDSSLRPRLRHLLLTLLVSAAPALLPASAAAQAPGSPESEIVREITRLDAIWLGATLTKDVEAVREVLADDFVGQLGDFEADKDAILQRIATATTIDLSLERLIVNVYGDVAVAHAIRRRVDRTPDGASVEARWAYTDVYRWDGDRWLAFTGQSANLPSGS